MNVYRLICICASPENFVLLIVSSYLEFVEIFISLCKISQPALKTADSNKDTVL